MRRSGIATFGLDWGRCPAWLFEKMNRLARLITEAIVYQFGPEVFVRRLADPFFFQSLGTVLAFDWDASGLTTTTTGALKEALRGTERELGLFVAGGKGKTSLKTPADIENFSQRFSFDSRPLIYASKMAAKVDNSALQDGFTLYHHSFIFTRKGLWTVIQQGMNPNRHQARRYHWLSDKVDDFVEEPHAGIADATNHQPARRSLGEGGSLITNHHHNTLNLVAKESRKTRETSARLVAKELPLLLKDLKVLNYVNFPFDRERLEKTLSAANEVNPGNFEQLLGIRGVGPKTIRALSLVAEIIYGARPSYQDPARYSFAHGGKDGIPYPVDRTTYEATIAILDRALTKARLGYSERLQALRRLHHERTT